MPEFSLSKIDEHHDRCTLDFAGTSQEQGFQRVIPDPVPETHEVRVYWTDHRLADGKIDRRRPRRLCIECVPKDAPKDAGPAARDGIATVNPTTGAKVVIPPELVTKLTALTDPDLETEAGVLGVSVFINGKGGKKFTRPQLMARVAQATVEGKKPSEQPA